MDVLTFAICRAMHIDMALEDVHLSLEVDENGAGTLSLRIDNSADA